MHVGTRILTVEDDERIRTAVRLALEDEGWEVEETANGEEALAAFTREPSDVVLIDIMLPGVDGFEVCRSIRRTSAVPIVMVTARSDTHDVVAGLEAGADDYLTKPFENIELLARVEALLRRSATSATIHSTDFYEFGDVFVDFRKSEVTLSGKLVDLSAREFQLLCYFIENRESLLSRDELLNNVWGYDVTPSTRTVDVHIARLRQKIEVNPKYPVHIRTVHGMGYKFIG